MMNENQEKPETWDFLNPQNKDRQFTPSPFPNRSDRLCLGAALRL